MAWYVCDIDDGVLRVEPTRKAAVAWWVAFNVTGKVIARTSYGPGSYEYTVGYQYEDADQALIVREDRLGRIEGKDAPRYPYPDRPFDERPEGGAVMSEVDDAIRFARQWPPDLDAHEVGSVAWCYARLVGEVERLRAVEELAPLDTIAGIDAVCASHGLVRSRSHRWSTWTRGRVGVTVMSISHSVMVPSAPPRYDSVEVWAEWPNGTSTTHARLRGGCLTSTVLEAAIRAALAAEEAA